MPHTPLSLAVLTAAAGGGGLLTCTVVAAAALGGNLGGITSFLLGLDQGQLAGQLKLDVLVPVKGFKRCVDYQNGYGEALPARRPAHVMLTQAVLLQFPAGVDVPGHVCLAAGVVGSWVC
jgi:hypothetical protein